MFTYVKTELYDKRRIVTFDVRGHGHSEAGESKLTIPLIAEDMRRLLDECGIRTAYVCSYGAGSLAALLALKSYPDRFRGGILISGAPGYHDLISRTKLKAAHLASRFNAKRAIALQSAWSEADNRPAFQGMMDDAMQGDVKRWQEYIDACLRVSLERELHGIRQPMLLIYGTSDHVGSHYASAMYRMLPNVEMYGIQGAERKLLMKEPGKTALIMRQWIDKLENGALADTFEERDALMQELAQHGITGGVDGENWAP
ncbi:pimeloyl-ACP methyl ester carboxylesterase [Paenibacillus phyllosphaerae]|uniref:Pimeloyl-ACP methyl ester carboxylesterase n=1 Tax=Paenibacillus phyllosphaerae TaxID=274593 RepID=A0A7W5ATC5_9BACL|nr:pimeloyl-ACP methyl ester carboxylesterase [Paenibacillus phyllosphaerae]